MGLETLASCLAVSPLARSADSLNRGRNNSGRRHGDGRRAALRIGERQHASLKIAQEKGLSKGNFGTAVRKPLKRKKVAADPEFLRELRQKVSFNLKKNLRLRRNLANRKGFLRAGMWTRGHAPVSLNREQ